MIDIGLRDKKLINFDGEEFVLMDTQIISNVGGYLHHSRPLSLTLKNSLKIEKKYKDEMIKHFHSQNFVEEPWGYWKYDNGYNRLYIYPKPEVSDSCWLKDYHHSSQFIYYEKKYAEAVTWVYRVRYWSNYQLNYVKLTDIPKWFKYVSREKPYKFPKPLPKGLFVVYEDSDEGTLFIFDQPGYLKVKKELESIGYKF